MKKIKDPSDYLELYLGLPLVNMIFTGTCLCRTMYGNITFFSPFEDIIDWEEISTFADQVMKLYSTEKEWRRDVKIFKIKCVSIMIVLIIFWFPLFFMFF